MRRLVKLGLSSKLVWRLCRIRILTRLPAGEVKIRASSVIMKLTQKPENTDSWHGHTLQPEGHRHTQFSLRWSAVVSLPKIYWILQIRFICRFPPVLISVFVCFYYLKWIWKNLWDIISLNRYIDNQIRTGNDIRDNLPLSWLQNKW